MKGLTSQEEVVSMEVQVFWGNIQKDNNEAPANTQQVDTHQAIERVDTWGQQLNTKNKYTPHDCSKYRRN